MLGTGCPTNMTVGINSSECLLPYTVLDIRDFLKFIYFKNT